jgi:hypothetical protein
VPGSLVGSDLSTTKDSDAMHTSTVKVLRGPITFGGWAFRLRDDRRFWMPSSGGLLSAARTPAGHETNRLVADRLAQHRVRVSGV